MCRSLQWAPMQRRLMLHCSIFVVADDARAGEEAKAERRLERKPAAPPGHHVDRQVRVLPQLELRRADKERAIGDRSQQNVARAKLENSAQLFGYTVFGKVVSGMDAVEKIRKAPTGPGGPFASDVPSTAQSILSAKILP